MSANLIVFEGLDGSGKSTALEKVSKHLTDLGVPHTSVACPSKIKGSVSEKCRQILLGGSQVESPTVEALLYAAAITDVLQNQIFPALARGEVVLCDRFFHTLVVYQGYCRKLDAPIKDRQWWLWKITSMIRNSIDMLNSPIEVHSRPDDLKISTLYFHVHTKVAIERLNIRRHLAGGEINHYDEASVQFYETAESAYHALARKRKLSGSDAGCALGFAETPYVIQANRTAQEVHTQVTDVVSREILKITDGCAAGYW